MGLNINIQQIKEKFTMFIDQNRSAFVYSLYFITFFICLYILSARCLCHVESFRASRADIWRPTNRRFKSIVYKTNKTYNEVWTINECVGKKTMIIGLEINWFSTISVEYRNFLIIPREALKLSSREIMPG